MGKGYSSLGNARGLGTTGRTGPYILVSGSGRGSFGRIFSYFSQNKKAQIIRSEAIFLYGVNGSVYRRGLSP